MNRYNIWLDHYNKRRDQILSNLQRYKQEIEALRNLISSKNLILPLDEPKSGLKTRMCFVDGGEGIRELLGIVIYFIRASGLIVDKIKGNERFVRDLEMNILDYDDHTKERVELLRSAMEFDVATRCINEYHPDYLFLDGSLYENSRKKPLDREEYQIYRKKFTRLLKLCKKESVHVIGISEDSRSKLFTTYVSIKYNVKFPRFMTDSSILRLIAKDTVYRTKEFVPQSYFESKEHESTITISFPTIYVQPTKLANPLRVDVPDWEMDLENIVDLILELSKNSGHYGYPLPLYLVHLDAKIEEKHTEWSTNRLIHYVSREDPELYDTILRGKRRSLRPI